MVAMLLILTFALALALPAVLMSPLFTAHIRGDGRAVPDPQTIGTIFAPPPPPPPPPRKSLILNELRQIISYYLVGYCFCASLMGFKLIQNNSITNNKKRSIVC